MRTALGLTAGIMGIVQAIPYVLSIVGGTTRPSRTSYMIWMVMDSLRAASYIAAGARTTMYWSLAQVITTVVIFGLSIRRGMGGTSTLDRLCLLIASSAMAVWAITGSPLVALYMTVVAGLMAYFPIFLKSHRHPTSENRLSWTMCVGASALNLMAVQSLALSIIIVPMASFLCCSLVAFLLWKPTMGSESHGA